MVSAAEKRRTTKERHVYKWEDEVMEVVQNSSENSALIQPWVKHYPVGVEWNSQFLGHPLTAALDAALARYSRRPCCNFLGKTTTYVDIGQQINKAAAGLQSIGVVKGTKVGLLLPNSPTFIVYYYAILKAGGVVVNFNPLYTVEEIAFQIRDSDTELMVSLDLKLLFDKVEALIQGGTLKRAVIASFAALLPSSKSVLFKLFRGKELARPMASPVADRLILDGALAEGQNALRPVAIDAATDLAVLQYTGGTTGTPKGAMLTHANLSINVQQSAAWTASYLRPGEERVLAVLPFFHVFAMTGIMNLGLSEGAEIIIQPRFVLDETVKLIAKSKPTVMPGVPTLFSAILHHRDVGKLDLKSLKVCLSGGAPLPLEVKRDFEALTGAKLVEAYGLSETSPGVTCNPLDGSAKAGSIGIPLPATMVSIRDSSAPEREVPLGQPGEICIKGPQVMAGYWKRPQETKDAFIGGYFRSGDIGYMDEQGFIFIVDRIKDMIICSGFKVFPRHVEERIYEHPAVEEVTVIGVKDAYRGEAPKAFVKLKEGMPATAEDLRKFLEPKLSKIEMPASFEFRTELPKTIIGKLSKKELKAEEAAKK
jgi:long-chain acyl-CoA synthetase